MEYTIYTLSCPRTQLVRYIGQTKHTIQIRLEQHTKLSKSNKGKKRHVNNWIRSLLDQGLKPLIQSICVVDSKDAANELERSEIAQKLKDGCDLCNHTSGGDSFEFTDETRRRMSDAHMGEKNHFFGKTHTKEARAIISQKNKEKIIPEAQRSKIAASTLGKKNHFFGKQHTAATKLLIAQKNAKTWRMISPERIEVEFTNLKQFCLANGLNLGGLWMVHAGRKNHHKGWRKP